MVTRISKASVVGLLGGLLVALSMAGCGVSRMVIPERRKTFTKAGTITGVEYDEAFSKAMRAAIEIGFDVATSDKSAGVFTGVKIGGFGPDSINLLLEKGSQGRFPFIVRVESGKGGDSIMNEFLTAYGKYVKISP